MNNRLFISKHQKILRLVSFSVCVILLVGFAGCAGKYGQFKRDREVYHAFENNKVNPEYKYYSNYQHNVTYAILGIESKFKLESIMWREIEPGTDDFNKFVSRIWEDYGYYKYGASVYDPDGNKVGVWYSAIFGKAIKFLENNQIQVMIDKPYLWGPDTVDNGGGIRMGR